MTYAVAVIVTLAWACGPPPTPRPRFGSLKMDRRELSVSHGIELFQVKNGLVVAVLPDRRTNLVTVDVRYRVGAAEDPAGRAGLAHLVEHLLFEAQPEPGGPTLGDQLADAALAYNAWTTWDETHYTATALAPRLDALIAVEARRMQVTCDQIDDARFLRERDVVLEEEAERGDQSLRAGLAAALWGARHPYARGVGTREVAAATRDEACAFITDHYGPDRAILVITGDVDVAAVQALVARELGPITRRSQARRVPIVQPDVEGRRSEHVADVDEASAVVFYPAPPWGGEGTVEHMTARAYLAHELAAMARERPWITDTTVGAFGGERSRVGFLIVSVDDPERLDDATRVIFDAARAVATRETWSVAEGNAVLASLRTTYAASWDSFLGRGSWIADFLQYTEHKWFFLQELAKIERIGPKDVESIARTIVPERTHVARIRPSGRTGGGARVRVATSGKPHDLQPWRTPVDAAEATRPLPLEVGRKPTAVVERRLANGMRVLLAPDPSSVIVDARVVFPVGAAADPVGKRGLAWATATVIDHDLDAELTRTEYQRILWAMQLGTSIDWYVGETATVFSVRGLSLFSDWHVWRLFWLLDAGVFASRSIDAMRARFDDDEVVDVTAREMGAALFGRDHPYAAPPMGGEDVRAIGADDLRRFRAAHYRAAGATVIVSGAFQLDAMTRELEELFGGWSDAPPPELAAVPPITPARGPTYLEVHDVSRTQANVTIAFAAASDPQRDRAARVVLEQMVQDRMRIVREGLGASYGVTAAYRGGAGGGALRIEGDIDPDRAGAALAAMLAELDGLRADAGALAEDFVRARRRALASELADAAGATDLADDLELLARRGLPVGWHEQVARDVATVTLDDVRALAAQDLALDRMVVAVTGRSAVTTETYQVAGIPAGSIQVHRQVRR